MSKDVDGQRKLLVRVPPNLIDRPLSIVHFKLTHPMYYNNYSRTNLYKLLILHVLNNIPVQRKIIKIDFH